MTVAVIELLDVAVGLLEDQAAAINAALAQPDVNQVVLPSGVIWIDQTVRVPAEKKLTLQPDTVLRALPTFSIVGESNAGVLLFGTRSQVSGGTIDMNKVGSAPDNRYNGVVVFDGARDCRRSDLTVMNCSGYGVYDAGSDSLQSMPGSFNLNVRTFNCQVHFEPQGADGTVYLNCHARDGDGDIGCLSWFHPDVGSRNIRFIGCTGHGLAAAGADLTGNIARLSQIYFTDCDIEVRQSSVALSVPAGWFGCEGLNVNGGRYHSDYIAASIKDSTATFVGVQLEGGVALEAINSVVDCTGCQASGGTVSGGSAVGRGIVGWGTAKVRWNGGSIRVVGPAGSTTTAGSVIVSIDTEQVPPPPGTPIQRTTIGAVDFVSSGAGCLADLQATFNDPNKIHLMHSVQALATASAVTGTANPYWVILDIRTIRVYFPAIDYAGKGYKLHWQLVETI